MVVDAVKYVPSRLERSVMKQIPVTLTKDFTVITLQTGLDMIAVGCELNGVYYVNGQAFQPTPLYKCLCVSGAIGCTPVFTSKAAASQCVMVKGRKKSGHSNCGPGQQKQLQSTGYRLMPDLCQAFNLLPALRSLTCCLLSSLQKSTTCFEGEVLSTGNFLDTLFQNLWHRYIQ
ncbi:WNT1 inducible signaling pathway protein 3 [Chelydra serpentina]|uniref:WNT1 inducible signaling pathway protein 3 n=1 Tax=Chelydra serpentina TaxID=8475 RepID=A0A8T1SZJ3_CHESE|nr:WNT1 inducible signaling pathway protein 3 [Chelydra serpentina]